MGWNEPEDNNRKNNGWDSGPGKGKNDGPPDLDEALASLLKKFNDMFGGKGGKNRGFGQEPDKGGSGGLFGGMGIAVLVIAALIWVGMGFYQIDEGERGVVLRFGRALDGVKAPGLNWNPWLVDEVHKVNVTLVRSESFSNPMLTEDDNIVFVSMSVQYQATDARAYFLQVRDPIVSLQQAAESAIRHEIGSTQMEPAMNEARELIATNVLARLQSYMDLYGTGITVNQVNINESRPPDPVRAAYDDVIKAGEDREAFQNQANAYANQVIPEARGRARRIIEEANAYRDQLIAEAEGEANRFEQLLVEYQKAPLVTRERLYLDTLEDVYAVSSKVLIDVDGGDNMMYLPLDRLMEGRQAPEVTNQRLRGLSNEEISELADIVIRDIQSRPGATSSNSGGIR